MPRNTSFGLALLAASATVLLTACAVRVATATPADRVGGTPHSDLLPDASDDVGAKPRVRPVVEVHGRATTPAASSGPLASPPARHDPVSFEVRRNLVFQKAAKGRKAMRFDLYIPDVPGPHPLAVVIPGGGWRFGNRTQPDCTLVARAFAQDGIAAASISYRPAPSRSHPAQFEDCKAAVRHFRKNAKDLGIDAAKIFTIGASAGGHLAALLGMQDDDALAKPNAVVAIAAPFDFARRPGDDPTPQQLRILSDFLGLPIPKPRELAAGKTLDAEEWLGRLEVLGQSASPLEFVDGDDPPVLIVHGDNDPVVPFAQALRMQKALSKHSVLGRLHVVKNGHHGTFLMALAPMVDHDEFAETERVVPEFWLRIRAFLKAQLGVRRS